MLARRDPVEGARRALEAGAHSRAIRYLWRGTTNASQDVDVEALEALADIAARLADSTRGRRQEAEAETVRRYAAKCLEDARQGIRPTGGALGQLIELRRRMP